MNIRPIRNLHHQLIRSYFDKERYYMDMIIKTTHAELPEIVDTLSESELLIDSHNVENEDFDPDKVITCGPLYVLEDLGISVIEGMYYTYNSDEDTHEPDFDISIIYNTTSLDDFDYNSYIYWEQDPPMTAIHNYLNITKG